MTKCGYVAIVGRPNVGKSTLLNALLGEKISITSPKPQTTRWQILGINTLFKDEQPSAQIIYIDTPGMHSEQKRAMNRYMNRIAKAVVMDADVIVFMVDALNFKEDDKLVLQNIKNVEKPVILVINKIDLVRDKNELLPFIEKISKEREFIQVVPLSARDKLNTDELEKEIVKLLPESELYYPPDQLTDKPIRFLTAEIIREKIIAETEEELPYTTAVAIEEFKEGESLVEISAVIWVERQGQKVIIIGKKGERLKKIGTKARLEIEKLVDKKVFLRLWIKVKEDWTDDERALRSFGYE